MPPMTKPLNTAIVMALLAASGAAFAANPADNTQLKLRLLETTDIHMNLLNYNYFTGKPDEKIGLAKAATLIKAAQAEVANSLLVDNGDLLQGSPMGDYMARTGLTEGQVHPAYKAMNSLGYVVGNIGNHEFNFGLDFLNQALKGANFPYINANVFIDDGDTDESNDKPYFQPYLISQQTFRDTQGNEQTLNIGFIGFVPPQIMNWDKANLSGKVITKDIITTAKRYVPIMKAEGADLIIAIPHSGLEVGEAKTMQENTTYHLSQVAGIDAILFGHAHNNFPGGTAYDGLSEQGVDNLKGSINGIPAVMPGFWANHIGLIDLNLTYQNKQWTVTSFNSELRAVENSTADKDIIASVAKEHTATDQWVSEPFAKIAAPVNSFFALAQDDPSVQVVSDAQRWYGKQLIQGTEYDGMPVLSAAAPFRAGRQGFNDFTHVPQGDIAFRNVADLYIYPNTLQILKLTGAQVRDWLEMSAGQFNQIDANSTAPQALINNDFPSYNFDTIDGVTYQIDLTQPAKYDKNGNVAQANAQRIVDLQFANKPIDATQDFLVVSNNYRANGGGNFPAISSDNVVIRSPNENRQVVADYITAQTKQHQGSFDPSADGNWSFKAINDKVIVTFRSSPLPEAATFAKGLPMIHPMNETDNDGFALYRMDLSPSNKPEK